MSKTAMPSPFPREGVYEVSSIHVDLSCATPGAIIRYTTDGSEPDSNSPEYHREEGLISLRNGKPTSEFCIKAYAEADGMPASEVGCYRYTLKCGAHGEYKHQTMRDYSETAPAIIRIEDFDLDKMYLIIGTKKAILFDAGMDETGNLVALCRNLIGRDIPLDVVIGHAHPDHIAHARRFYEAGCKVYIPYADRKVAAGFGMGGYDSYALDIDEGKTFDVGNAVYQIIKVSGHTPGGIVALDEVNGDLFASDELGSTRRFIPDSAWLQLSDVSAEGYLKEVRRFIKMTEGKVKRIFTGHSDDALPGDLYLRTLEKALEDVVNNGESALKPSLRSSKDSFGSGTAAIEGDWRLDPVWASINLRFLYEKDRTANPPKYIKGYTPNVNTEI